VPRFTVPFLRAALPPAAVLALAAGCSLDINRTRTNVPLNREAYRRLEVGRTSLEETLSALGAPDLLQSKSDIDYLWYLHRDVTRMGLRLDSPITYFGYRHTIAELDVDAEDTSSMRLVFNKAGVLEQKSLRLAPAFEEAGGAKPSWALYLMPRYGVSPFLLGDGGERGYQGLFQMGQLFGGSVGALPTPYFMLLLGGNYQLYQGQSFHHAASRVRMEDLRLYQMEIGGRFMLPPEFFVSFWDFNKVKSLFYSDDVSRHRGPFVYFQWTVGGTFNESVGAKIDGIPSGNYFDRSLQFSNSLGVGAEYRWTRLGVYGGIDYQTVGAFKDGNAPLDTKGGDLHDFVFSGGLSWKF
jgi:hypothetical protein